MSETTSTKPYLLRALYEWCTDNGLTPHLSVRVQGQVRVPMEFVRNGEIVLNIAFGATSGLLIDNEAIRFKARFGGVSRDIFIPVDCVLAIFASENGQGMAFEVTPVSAGTPVTAARSQDGADRGSDESEAQKPGISLAVTNTDEIKADSEEKSKETRKKPSFTVIK